MHRVDKRLKLHEEALVGFITGGVHCVVDEYASVQ